MTDKIGHELVMHRVDTTATTATGSGVVGVPDRATRVASWIGWHFFELTGVTVPTVVAVAATPWAWAVSGVVGAGWTAHEVRMARRNAAILAGRDLPAKPDKPDNGTDESTDQTSDVDTDNNAADTGADPADDVADGVPGDGVELSERVGGRDGVA